MSNLPARIATSPTLARTRAGVEGALAPGSPFGTAAVRGSWPVGQPDRRYCQPRLAVYADLRKRTARTIAEVVSRTVQVTLRDTGQAAAPDHIADAVVTETIRAASRSGAPGGPARLKSR